MQDQLREATMLYAETLLKCHREEFAKVWGVFMWRTLPAIELEGEPGVKYHVTIERVTKDHRLILQRIIAELKAGRIIEAQTIAEEAL